jgi:hypothetical protein
VVPDLEAGCGTAAWAGPSLPCQIRRERQQADCQQNTIIDNIDKPEGIPTEINVNLNPLPANFSILPAESDYQTN